MQTCGSPVVEWMSQRNFRLNPGQPESFERKRFEKRRTSCERMRRRTNVMHKSWNRKLRRARAPADRGVGFEDENRISRARQRDRGGEAIGPRAYNDCIIFDRHK